MKQYKSSIVPEGTPRSTLDGATIPTAGLLLFLIVAYVGLEIFIRKGEKSE